MLKRLVTELDSPVVDDKGLKLLSAQGLSHSPSHILGLGSSTTVLLGASPTEIAIAGSDALPSGMTISRTSYSDPALPGRQKGYDPHWKRPAFLVALEDVEVHLRQICAKESVAAAKLSVAGVRDGMHRCAQKYMVPTQIRYLERLPLSASGKNKREALTMLISGSAS